jgi:glutamate/aspartate transport system ATP-binding protein
MTSTPMPAPSVKEPVADAAHAPRDAGLQPGGLVSGLPEAPPGETMISIDNISKWYGDFQVLTNCTTKVAKGEVVVVCGPSGSGKSTLIKCVNALEPFQKGQVTVAGTKVVDKATNLPKLRSRVGMVFQHFELFPHLSITDNLTIAQRKVLGRSAEDAKKRGLDLLARVGLSAHADKFPGQLSGGQQQRVVVGEVLDVMVELAKEGMTMMVVTHEMGFARKVADRVIFMDRGEIVEDAKKEDFFGSPRSERAQTFLSKILQH